MGLETQSLALGPICIVQKEAGFEIEEYKPVPSTESSCITITDCEDDEAEPEPKTAQEAAEEPQPHVGQELKTLLLLVLPVAITAAIEYLPEFTSITIAGHIASTRSQQFVDAATLSSMFANITVNAVCFGLMTALDTLASQAHGIKLYGKIGDYFQAGLLVTAACFVPAFFLNWFSEHFLLHFGQDAEVSRLAQNFSRWTLLGAPFMFVYELVFKVLQAQNIMQPLVVIAIVGNIVNIVLGYLLAFHTSMGFEGIALARSLSNIVMLTSLVPYFRYRPEHLSVWWNGWDLKQASKHVMLFLELGVPGMLMLQLEWCALEILTLMAGMLPQSVVSMSAHVVVANVHTMMYMVFEGIGSAVNIRIGNCLGANAPRQAQLVCIIVLTITLAISSTLAAALFALSKNVPTVFLNDDKGVALAASVLVVWAPFAVLDGLNDVLQGICSGAGKQKAAAFVNGVAYYGFGLSSAALFAFQFQMGVVGLWLGLGVATVVSVSLQLYLLFRRWTWAELAHAAQKRIEE